MELEYPYGPWHRLAFGTWGEYPTAIYTNQERLILLAVFERDGAEIAGVLTTVTKAFLSNADLSKAARAQKREITVIEKHNSEASRRFVLVSAAPTYSPFSQKAVVNAVSKQVNEIRALTKSVEELAQAYNLTAKDLAGASEEDAKALLGDPFLLLSIINPSTPPTKESLSTARVPIGLDATGAPVTIPIQSLSTAIVNGGERKDRLAAMQVLIEAALSNSVPALVFDSSNAFSGLANPNSNTKDFIKFKMNAMPLGYPFKDFKLGTGYYIDLARVDGRTFTKSLGLTGTQPGEVIEKVWNGKLHSISDVFDALARVESNKDATAAYDAAKARRALKVAEKSLQGAFAKFVEGDLLAPWQEGIGRVYHLDSTQFGDVGQNLSVASMITAMTGTKTKRVRAVVAFETDLAGVHDETLELVNTMRDSGLGFLMHAEHELDSQLIANASLRIEIINANEATAAVAGEKPVRFYLRPTYTQPAASAAKA